MRTGGFSVNLILTLLVITNLNANGMREEPLWDTSRSLPTPEGLSGMVAGVSHNVLIVAGGCNFSKPVSAGGEKLFYDEIYVAMDPERLNWECVGKLPKAVANAAVVPVANGLLVMGGINGESVLDDVFFMYWDDAGQCIRVEDTFPHLPYPVESLSATCLDDTIYVAGGRTADGNVQRNFWRLGSNKTGGIASGQWEELPPWPGPCRAGAALLSQVTDGRVFMYLAGGKGSDYLNDMYRYEPFGGTWLSLAAIPRPAYYSTVVAGSGPYLMLFSGSDGHDATRAIALGDNYHMPTDGYCYLTTEDRWTPIGDLSVGVAGASAVRWGEKLIVLGGELRPGVRTSVIQVSRIADWKTRITKK